MREHFISLPEDVYCHLLAVAKTEGVTPADWIASQLSSDVDQQRPLAVLLSDLVGSINSQTETSSSYEKTVFGEAIASKLAKQGIRRP
ncbi:MAG: hypothetical protein PUP91_02635 [Rhizonema sp. PD37]|nr:hypothetical protein [Rhizonema sp. PD37]